MWQEGQEGVDGQPERSYLARGKRLKAENGTKNNTVHTMVEDAYRGETPFFGTPRGLLWGILGANGVVSPGLYQGLWGARRSISGGFRHDFQLTRRILLLHTRPEGMVHR